MIEQASVICGTGAFSRHCHESGRGGVFQKEIPGENEQLRILFAPDSSGYTGKNTMGKPVLCLNSLTRGTLERTGNVVFLLANDMPILKYFVGSQGEKAKSRLHITDHST